VTVKTNNVVSLPFRCRCRCLFHRHVGDAEPGFVVENGADPWPSWTAALVGALRLTKKFSVGSRAGRDDRDREVFAGQGRRRWSRIRTRPRSRCRPWPLPFAVAYGTSPPRRDGSRRVN